MANLRSAKVLLLCISMLLFSSCEDTNIENNTRILITGRVIDDENNPIADAKVEVTARANGANELILGFGSTDTNGMFNVTSLFGYNQSFGIQISKNDDYTHYNYFTNTENYIPENLEINLETKTLKRKAHFNFSLIRESTQGTTLEYAFTYQNPQCTENYTEGILNTNFPMCFDNRSINGVLNDELPNIENRTIVVPLNSTIEIVYSINNGEELSEIVSITEDNYEFNLSY